MTLTFCQGAHASALSRPAILKLYNTWLILSTEGDQTDDRPGIVARAPRTDGTLLIYA